MILKRVFQGKNTVALILTLSYHMASENVYSARVMQTSSILEFDNP